MWRTGGCKSRSASRVGSNNDVVLGTLAYLAPAVCLACCSPTVRKAAVESIKLMEKSGVLLPSYVTAAAERAQLEVTVPTAPRKY